MASRESLFVQVKRVGARLNKIESAISKEVLQRLVDLSGQILEESNSRCPYATGELRNSAVAKISRGRSRSRQIVKWIGAASSRGGGTVFGVGYPNPRGSYRWSLDVSYNRMSDGFDIAAYTHEYIEPSGGVSPAARKSGTGPKYLELAFKRHSAGFVSRLGVGLYSRIERFDIGGRI